MKNGKNPERDNRRYKYGSISVVLSAVFIALVICLNLIFSSLSLSGDLTVDLTREEFTNIGEETQRLLSDLGKDLDVTICFMSARDKFDLKTNEYNGINLTGICRDLAESYAKAFDGSGETGVIRVEYRELNEDPEFEKKYLEEAGSSLSRTSVIVQGKYHYRVLDLKSFFTTDDSGNYTAFNGESRLTSAVLRASLSSPQIVTFTYGHGEPFAENGAFTRESAYGLYALLAEAGFEIKTADISREEIDPSTRILICYDPVSDFTNGEIDALERYLSSRKSFMVFVDSDTSDLKMLRAALNDNWGIDYAPFDRVTDSSHAINNKSENVLADKPDLGNADANYSAAYQIRKTVFDFEGKINTVFPESTRLYMREAGTRDGFISENVLTSYETAVTKEGEGAVPLMLLSAKQGIGENNSSVFSYVMLVGSTDFASASNLTSSYGNRRVLLSAFRMLASEDAVTDILGKTFVSTALDIENGEARTLTLIICTVLPGAIMIMGLAVYFRRRHK